MLFFFFFFQAEDGIRDIGVTGVQTCALPILLAGYAYALALTRWLSARAQGAVHLALLAAGALALPVALNAAAAGRSEERRVGEEGRSRWLPDQLKKKKDR